MARFRKKPEIVEARQVSGRDLWVVRNKDGSETQYDGDLFRQLYERVTDNYQVHAMHIDPRRWDQDE